MGARTEQGQGQPGHSHGNGHAGHTHGVTAGADHRWLSMALALISVFIVVETAVAVLAGSLALLSDAAHMLTDAVSIVLALVAMRLSARPARGGYTFGLKRAEILSAHANGLTLILAAVWLAYEAIRRLLDPPEVTGWMVVTTALVGIVVNLLATWCLSRANRSSLNVEGAYQHILNDLFAFIGTAVAGLVVLVTGYARADAIATLLVVGLMLKAGYGLLRDSGRIFLEAAPVGLDPDEVGDELASAESVTEVHDLHIWTITSGEPALSAHILVEPGGDCHRVRRDLDRMLAERHGLTHTTLQIDHADPIPAGAHALSSLSAGHCETPHGPVHHDGPHPH
ncbi:cation diffusion facilitator family transporter [Streptomyces spirodelae]|uniref:Cation transporter n=1 Tax=Streptomyces spirodelae TaxID=2812904 RepID=A0ABS3WSZ2_9ACTN|nr:cation diffusion facilitator family transporter [Streptomyces spirodelae]MBO8186212.1 cation transporter [Streptomyces spirodelae]